MKTLETIRKRLVRRSEMVPCKSAFIDTYTPGSHLKDNFQYNWTWRDGESGTGQLISVSRMVSI